MLMVGEKSYCFCFAFEINAFELICLFVCLFVCISCRYQELINAGINSVIRKREVKSQYKNLTEQDLFFREVCDVDCLQNLTNWDKNIRSS